MSEHRSEAEERSSRGTSVTLGVAAAAGGDPTSERRSEAEERSSGGPGVSPGAAACR